MHDDALVIPCVRPRLGIPVSRLLDDAGRMRYVADEILAEGPRARDPEVEVHFFKTGKWIDSDEVLREEYARRGLAPADIDVLFAVNTADRTFADVRPNATHWYDGKRWCYLSFRLRLGHRAVTAGMNYLKGWQQFWWYAGIPVRPGLATLGR